MLLKFNFIKIYVKKKKIERFFLHFKKIENIQGNNQIESFEYAINKLKD